MFDFIDRLLTNKRSADKCCWPVMMLVLWVILFNLLRHYTHDEPLSAGVSVGICGVLYGLVRLAIWLFKAEDDPAPEPTHPPVNWNLADESEGDDYPRIGSRRDYETRRFR